MLVRQAADEIAAVGTSLEQLGDLNAARIAYRAAAEIDFGDSELQQSWGGPFNGQEKRCALFLDLIERVDPQMLIETGTYRATTTKFMAEHFERPIFTCEIAPRQFFQSQKKLTVYPHVSVVEADSRRFLEDVLKRQVHGTSLFFYLDAHWQEDLPLREELEIILRQRQPSIIMIDDFRVPFDAGYGFDDYGPGKVLDLNILGFLRDQPVHIFFPQAPSELETGAKRGCAVLSTADLAPLVAPSEFLRAADWRDWMLIQSQTELSQAMAERAAGEARLTELEATLVAERAAGEARLTELEATLAAERAAGEARLTELEATLVAERAAGEARLTELEATLVAERAAGEARLTELEATLVAERAANQARVAEREAMLQEEREKNVNDKVRLTSELHGLRRRVAELLPNA